jgi:hypothetical protein
MNKIKRQKRSNKRYREYESINYISKKVKYYHDEVMVIEEEYTAYSLDFY